MREVMTVNLTTSNTYKQFFEKAGFKTSRQPDSDKNAISSALNLNFSEHQTTTTKSKKKIFGLIGVSAGSVLLLTIISLTTLSKGFSGSIARHLKKVSEQARKKIYELKASRKELTKNQKIQLKISKVAKYTSEAMQASANISAIKDGFTQHLLNKMKLGKVTDKINEVFKKISLKTKTNAYQKAEISLVEFCNSIDAVIEKIPESSIKARMKENVLKLLEQYSKTFSTQRHMQRSELVWEKLKTLHEDVYNAIFRPKDGFMKNLKAYKTYVTTDLSAKQTDEIYKDVIRSKRLLSNALIDVQNEIKNELFKLKIIVNVNNGMAISKLKEMATLLETNKTLNGPKEQKLRAELYKSLEYKLDELIDITKEDFVSSEAKQMLMQSVQNFRCLLNEDAYKKGLLQEIVTDVKKLSLSNDIAEQEYKALHKFAAKVNKSLNNAIECEDIAYEKLAELRVGSASTDIIGILGPAALATFFVVNSKNKKERISNTLTKGIPILGGIAVSYYGTTRGFTGVKNLVIGLVTGLLLNALGHETDVFVKKHRKEQEKLKKAFEALKNMQKSSEKATV